MIGLVRQRFEKSVQQDGILISHDLIISNARDER